MTKIVSNQRPEERFGEGGECLPQYGFVTVQFISTLARINFLGGVIALAIMSSGWDKAYAKKCSIKTLPTELPDYLSCTSKGQSSCKSWEPLGDILKLGEGLSIPGTPARLYFWSDSASGVLCAYLPRGKPGGNEFLHGTWCMKTKDCRLQRPDICFWDLATDQDKLGQLKMKSLLEPDDFPRKDSKINPDQRCDKCHPAGPVLPKMKIFNPSFGKFLKAFNFAAGTFGVNFDNPPDGMEGWNNDTLPIEKKYNRVDMKNAPAGCTQGCHQNLKTMWFRIPPDKESMNIYCTLVAYKAFMPNGGHYEKSKDKPDLKWTKKQECNKFFEDLCNTADNEPCKQLPDN